MSTHHTDALQISRRYATAIFDLALTAKKERAVVAEMTTLANAIEQNAALAETLANPVIHQETKTALLAELMSKADAMTSRAVETIAVAGRASLIPVIAGQLRDKLRTHSGEMAATITSARALAPATQKRLEQSLAEATGKTVQLTLKQDPSVLGGLLIELGSLRLDATLSGALTSMREQLLAPTH